MTDSEWRAVIEARLAHLERMCGVERNLLDEDRARRLAGDWDFDSRLAPAAGDVRDHLLQGFERDPEERP